MGFDFFSIQSLAKELQELLQGRQILDVASGADSLSFSCSRQGHLHAQVGGKGILCFQPGKIPQGKKDGPERYLLGAWVDEVWAEKRDRLVRLRLRREDRSGVSTYGQLLFELVHPRFQAVLLSQRNQQVLGCWSIEKGGDRTPRVVVGQPYAPLPGQERVLPGEDDFGLFCAALEKVRGPMQKKLTSLLPGLDKTVVSEIIHRAGLVAQQNLEDMQAGEKEHLWQAASSLYSAGPESGGYLWWEGEECFFSGLKPTHKGDDFTFSPSISQAILRWQEERKKTVARTTNKQRLQQALKRQLQVVRRRLQAVQEDLDEADQADEWERKGSILMAQLALIRPGSTQVELPDIYDIGGSRQVLIELDPGRTPVENGSRYLRGARKYRRRLELLPGRLQLLAGEYKTLEGLMQQLEGGTEEEMKDTEKWLYGEGLLKEKHKNAPQDQARPRRYRTSDGWSVWAGRNNRENDILTHRLAAQNDIWFHAHGYSGSHVVMRREGRKEEPSARTLAAVAALAAYWSKGKTAKKVAVVYTLVKYVSKPRGGVPGLAVLRREKTIMVEPALLPQED